MASINLAERKSLRLISHSEVSTYHQCQRRHDFAYAGQLLGGETLRAKVAAPILRDGRAWGAAVAEWHLTGDHGKALAALNWSLNDDAEAMQDAGVPAESVDEQMVESRDLLTSILDHYIAQHEGVSFDITGAGRIAGHSPEEKILVAIPSRSGKGDSNRYGLDARLDLVYTDSQGLDWIVEFKLRKSLTNYDQLTRMQQLKWYAWAWHKATGRKIAGVIIDERLKAVPKPPRMVQSQTITDRQKAYRAECKAKGVDVDKERDAELRQVPSTAKDQMCLPHEYESLCVQGGFEVDREALAAYEARQWGQRVPLFFTSATLDEVGHQLVSAASQIRDADTGKNYPLTNATQMNCGGCPFKDICSDPHNVEFVDAYFDRRPPKAEAIKAARAAA